MTRPLQTDEPFVCTDLSRFNLAEVEDTIPNRFKRIVAAYGDRPAVLGRELALTYAELDARSDKLADRILTACGSRSSPVAVFLPQGPEACVAIVGVLKAGKFYVPLDPRSPPNWLASVIEDVRPKLVVTDAKHGALARSLAPGACEFLSIFDDAETSPFVERERVDHLRLLTPDSLCYVYFTSGTTGTPKGVMDTHRNVLHNVMRYTNALSIGPSDRLTLLQPIEFSGCVSSTFAGLLNGACVVPVDLRKENALSAARWFEENGVTIYHSVPSIFRSILEAFDRDVPFQSVRVVRLEGDRASVRDIELFRARFNEDAVLVNGLGMTEAGIVCQHFVDSSSESHTVTVPVGFPCEGMEVSVVGEGGRPLAVGEVGTIEVKSQFLSPGYWKKPEKTAEVFRDTNEGDRSRIYRTSDLGRYRGDGAIEHLGRTDTRVRLDGRWIETLQVEDALARVPGVREAAVACRRGYDDRSQLVGYICCESDTAPDLHTIRSHLLNRLSPSQIPSRVVKLDQLPLTANGKVNRAALPDPGPKRRDLETDAVAPSGTLQRKLVELWEDLLEIDGLGIRDDFFDLGGTSVLALEMLGRVEGLFDRRLDPEVMMSDATVEGLADALMQNESELRAPIVALQTDGDGLPVFFLHGDYVSWGYYSVEIARRLGEERPFYALRPVGPGDGVGWTSYAAMAAWHLGAIRTICPEGPFILAGRCNGGMVAYEMARLLQRRGEDVPLVIMIEASAANLRFQSLYERVELLRFVGVGIEKRSRFYLRLRNLLDRPDGVSLSEKFLKKVVRYRKQGGRERRKGQLVPAESPQTTAYTVAQRWSVFPRIYHRVDHLSFPGSYNGPIVVLWPDEKVDETIDEARSYWTRVCSQVHVRPVCGDAVTCLTRHVDVLADAMKGAIREFVGLGGNSNAIRPSHLEGGLVG